MGRFTRRYGKRGNEGHRLRGRQKAKRQRCAFFESLPLQHEAAGEGAGVSRATSEDLDQIDSRRLGAEIDMSYFLGQDTENVGSQRALVSRNRASGMHARLEGAVAGLLVDMAEALALLAVLEDHGDGDDEEGVDADKAEDGGEDVVEEDVGK
jgi:hypothetical protein